VKREKIVELSRFLSYILRHHPEEYGVSLDRYGFTKLKELVKAINKRKRRMREEDIRIIVEESEKKRFEIEGDRIRATYGHSLEVEQVSPEVEPPQVLFHGTSRKALESILRDGLKPMERQYVHLCETEEEAYRVGRRKDRNPVVLKVKAREAFIKGIKFRKYGSVYMAKEVPGKFIENMLGKKRHSY